VKNDKETFDKVLQIITSKSQKPEEEFFSSRMIRYNEVTENVDVIGCAKVINELKIYFDENTKIKDGVISYRMMFIKALRIIAELYSYHNGEGNDKNWENTVKILNSINISENHEIFTELKSFFSKRN